MVVEILCGLGVDFRLRGDSYRCKKSVEVFLHEETQLAMGFVHRDDAAHHHLAEIG